MLNVVDKLSKGRYSDTIQTQHDKVKSSNTTAVHFKIFIGSQRVLYLITRFIIRQLEEVIYNPRRRRGRSGGRLRGGNFRHEEWRAALGRPGVVFLRVIVAQ